ncbi:MAG TPA: class I SAM-dependent methyltransferase [Usitatibacter sp.]|nr:class I SAM-dependent methyltransferase [Usitatibacter sp.]
MAFTDFFSEKSQLYASARPTYPDALFRFIAETAPGRERAWDCATGSGQAAVGLARHFARVEATDASAQQVANGLPAANVRYSVQLAESTDFESASFDAVNVAQAVHWFDLDRFYAEVRRVLRPRGVLAISGYGWSHVTPAVDFALERHLLARIKPFWPRQTAVLQGGYRDLPFPFERIDVAPMRIEMSWTVEQYLAYAGTWSATRSYIAAHGGEVMEATEAALRRAWGGVGPRSVVMPLHVLCGRYVP